MRDEETPTENPMPPREDEPRHEGDVAPVEPPEAGQAADEADHPPAGPSDEELAADAVAAEEAAPQRNLPTLDPDEGEAEEERADGAGAATVDDARDDAAEREGASESGAPAATARRGRLSRAFADARTGWVVAGVASVAAVLALAAAIIFALWWAPLHAEASAREEVRATATDFAVHLATFSGEDIDTWVAETQERATGAYAEQVNSLFDAELRSALAELEVESTGTLLNLFVQGIEGDRAEVFAVVRQEVTNVNTAEPFSDELRLEMEFTREGDVWLASNVAVLGPSASSVPAPAVPDEQGEPPTDPDAADLDPQAPEQGS